MILHENDIRTSFRISLQTGKNAVDLQTYVARNQVVHYDIQDQNIEFEYPK